MFLLNKRRCGSTYYRLGPPVPVDGFKKIQHCSYVNIGHRPFVLSLYCHNILDNWQISLILSVFCMENYKGTPSPLSTKFGRQHELFSGSHHLILLSQSQSICIRAVVRLTKIPRVTNNGKSIVFLIKQIIVYVRFGFGDENPG